MTTQQITRRREALLLILPILIFGFVTGSVLIGIQPYDARLAMAGFYATTAILVMLYFAARFYDKAVEPAAFAALSITTAALIGRVYEVKFGTFLAEIEFVSVMIAIYVYLPILVLFGFMLLSRQLAMIFAIAIWLAVLLMVLLSNLNSFFQPVWPEGLDHLISVVGLAYPMFIVLVHRVLPFSDVINAAKDETETAREALSDMEKLVLVDKLTGIYNRRFLATFWETFTGENRYNSRYLSLFIIDIDFFKQFNDNAGHIAGDACLKRIAGELGHLANDFGGHAVRYGGEEFLVIIPSDVDLDTMALAEQIRYSIQDLQIPHPAPEISFVSVSIGATSGTRNSDISESDWMRAADAALYDAKGAGRNCTSVRSLTLKRRLV
jgi:diguanylate cyclase (GGDEF)-like protein